jgi:hypothetical protein
MIDMEQMGRRFRQAQRATVARSALDRRRCSRS